MSKAQKNVKFQPFETDPTGTPVGWFCTGCLQEVTLTEAAANDIKDASNTDIVELMTTPGHGKRQCPVCHLRAVVPYTTYELTKYIQSIQDTIKHNDTLKRELKRATRLKDEAQTNVELLRRHVDTLEDRANKPIVKITDTAEVDRLNRRVAELERLLNERGITVPSTVRHERGVEF